MRIVIIGAGPGGICAGIGLLRAGFDEFVILEKGPRVGGTWWHNRYPGAACDIQAHLYSYSFALKADWSRPYATQPEILAYFEDCANRYGLMPHARLGVEVRTAHWDDDRHFWTLTTQNGESMTADVLISAVGMFNELSWPAIPGLQDFSGTAFHSAKWRQEHNLFGRRVGIVGSAASAVQIAPRIAPLVDQLYVFQRTPNWVLPKDDEPYDDEAIDRLRMDPIALSQARLKIWRNFNKLGTFDPDTCRMAEKEGLKNLAVVTDPDRRIKLTPNYAFGRKRPLRSNEFYPMFNRANVELVTDRIARIDPDAIVTGDGGSRPVDTIIMATGFATYRFASTIEMYGAGGQSLEETWSNGAQAYLGITTAGFPNFYMLYGPNTNNGSIIYMIECQTAYILRQLERMRDEVIRVLHVRKDIQDLYNVQLQKDLSGFEVWNEGVNSYYRSPSGRLVTQCPYLMPDYRELTATPDPGSFESISAR